MVSGRRHSPSIKGSGLQLLELSKAGQLRQHQVGMVSPARAALMLPGTSRAAADASPPRMYTSGFHQALLPESWSYPWPLCGLPAELPRRLEHLHLSGFQDPCPPRLSGYLSLCGAVRIRASTSRDQWLCCLPDFSPFSLAALGQAHPPAGC